MWRTFNGTQEKSCESLWDPKYNIKLCDIGSWYKSITGYGLIGKKHGKFTA